MKNAAHFISFQLTNLKTLWYIPVKQVFDLFSKKLKLRKISNSDRIIVGIGFGGHAMAKMNSSTPHAGTMEDFQRLIRQQEVDEDALEAILAENDIAFCGEIYTALCISIDDISPSFFDIGGKYSVSNLQTAFFMVEKLAKEILDEEFVCFVASKEVWVCFICCANKSENDADFIKRLKIVLAELVDFAWDKGGLKLCISVSAIHEGYGSFHLALGEAVKLQQYRTTLGISDKIMVFKDFVKPNFNTEDLTIILQFLKCIQLEDYPRAKDAIMRYIKECFEDSTPPVQCFEEFYWSFRRLINMALNAMERAGHTKALTSIDINWRMSSACTVTDYVDCIMSALNAVIISTKASGVESLPSWYQPMVTYIEQHYPDVNLNVSTLAEVFGMNSAYTSRAFKRYSGVSIPDFINRIRMMHARKLIMEGKTIFDTAIAVGYGSPITMRRAFKKYEGCVPSKLTQGY